MILGFIDAGNRADKILTADVNAEGVILQCPGDIGNCAAVKATFQCIDEGNRLSVCIGNSFNAAQCSIGVDDREYITGAGYSLCFQDAVAIVMLEADESDDRTVLDNAFVIIDIGVLEIQLATGTAADERAGEPAIFVECLHHKGLTV